MKKTTKPMARAIPDRSNWTFVAYTNWHKPNQAHLLHDDVRQWLTENCAHRWTQYHPSASEPPSGLLFEEADEATLFKLSN